jgi:hypothetical protein
MRCETRILRLVRVKGEQYVDCCFVVLGKRKISHKFLIECDTGYQKLEYNTRHQQLEESRNIKQNCMHTVDCASVDGVIKDHQILRFTLRDCLNSSRRGEPLQSCRYRLVS